MLRSYKIIGVSYKINTCFKIKHAAYEIFLFTDKILNTLHANLLPPPNFFQKTNSALLLMKSALFVQANVAANTKLTSKMPFLFGNFDVFKKNLLKNVQFRYGMTGKLFFAPPPHPTLRRQHFREKNFRCPFQYSKLPLEAGAPQSFDASYAPEYIT